MIRSGATKSSPRVEALLAWAKEALYPSPTASLDAELLLAHVLDKDRSWVLTHADENLMSSAEREFLALLERRRNGEPVAYLRGYVDWWDMQLEVSPAVLVPRPETELLLEEALKVARLSEVRLAADIGTGSGALAIGLAREFRDFEVIAVDSSAAALAVALRNAEKNGVGDRVRFMEGRLLAELSVMPDLIVANLPYLSGEMMATLPTDVRYEPTLALFGGSDGLDVYRGLFRSIADRSWSCPVLVEIDPQQADSLSGLVHHLFPHSVCSIISDYSGRARIVSVV